MTEPKHIREMDPKEYEAARRDITRDEKPSPAKPREPAPVKAMPLAEYEAAKRAIAKP